MKVPEPVSGKQKEWDEGDGLAYRSGKAGSRKDRHSKVITSKGARDRRIRLSVDTATRLFHIQQSLGLQHPSQAIDWLICTCEAAIKGFSCFLFQEGERNPDLVTYLRSLVPPKKKQQKLNRSNKSRLAKVNDHRREKARKRARERTLNKLKAQTSSALPAFQSSLPAVECDEYRTEIPLDVTENIVICASGTDLRYAFDGILATQDHELNPNFSHEKVTSPLVEEFCYVPLWD